MRGQAPWFRWCFACNALGVRTSPPANEPKRTGAEVCLSAEHKRADFNTEGTEDTETEKRGSGRARSLRLWALRAIALLAAGGLHGCGGGGGTVGPPPPPPQIQVTVAPKSGSVILGNTTNFSGSVSNSADQAVNWSVNGVAGGNALVGTISASGVYTAPVDLPSPATVTVTATSRADGTKSDSAAVTVTSDIAVNIAPNSGSVELGAVASLRATVTSSGHPDMAVRWSLSGGACPGSCGGVDSSGNYTAPGILPAASSVTVTATSVADPSKQAPVTLNLTSNFTLQLTAPASLPAGGSATIVATLTPVPGSNPSSVLNWSVSGTGCSGASCGTLSTVTTQSTGSNAMTESATYTAPSQAPSPNTVTILAMPQADATKKAQASIAIQPGVAVSVTPGTATLAVNHRVTLTAQVSGTANTAVSWSANGVAGGNATVGQICVVGSSPCQTVTSGNTLQVDYVAPGTGPAPNPVMVQATSTAEETKSGSAQVTVINHVLVSVQPPSATLAPLSQQTFAASVLGASNQSVVWQVQGAACAAAGACGTVDANGIYTAPMSAPTPNALQVVAISRDDTAQSGAANVTVSTGANILGLHPASVYAGGANGFTLRADGSGFAASTPGPGSTLLIGGTARTTACSSATECTAPVTAADVATDGSVTVQVRNPSGTSSNAVALIVAAPNAADEVISLTGAAPTVTGKDIVVVEPTTAGISSPGNPLDLNVAAIGAFSTANNSCALTGNPVALVRPANGTASVDVCLFSQSGFDISMTYAVSGSGDVAVITKQPAGLGIIHLTLQVAANAVTGARTLFIQNTNLDKTAASGALEVQ